MRKQKQTTFGKGKGNCFSACIATLLDVDLADVPTFCAESRWMEAADKWLQQRGYTYMEIGWQSPDVQWTWHGEFYAICCGPTTRENGSHAVIMRITVNKDGNHEAEHYFDPHPSNAFLTELEYLGIIVPTWKR